MTTERTVSSSGRRRTYAPRACGTWTVRGHPREPRRKHYGIRAAEALLRRRANHALPRRLSQDPALSRARRSRAHRPSVQRRQELRRLARRRHEAGRLRGVVRGLVRSRTQPLRPHGRLPGPRERRHVVSDQQAFRHGLLVQARQPGRRRSDPVLRVGAVAALGQGDRRQRRPGPSRSSARWRCRSRRKVSVWMRSWPLACPSIRAATSRP